MLWFAPPPPPPPPPPPSQLGQLSVLSLSTLLAFGSAAFAAYMLIDARLDDVSKENAVLAATSAATSAATMKEIAALAATSKEMAATSAATIKEIAALAATSKEIGAQLNVMSAQLNVCTVVLCASVLCAAFYVVIRAANNKDGMA